MVLPMLMFKIWDGDEQEYFTYLDMNRVEYNANIIARESNIDQVTFIETTHASQFRYDEAQKLEDLIQALADAHSVPASMETQWGYSRTVSYVDFERWESVLFAVYQSMGGTGERIPAGTSWVTVSAVLFADDWKGTGPYHQDLDIPWVFPDTEAVAFVAASATLEQRVAEYNALLFAKTLSDRMVRVFALWVRPRVNLPVRIAIGGLQMQQIVTLPASGWEGNGPWTQTVTLSEVPTDAIIGAHESMTDEQVEALAMACISASGISGTSLTVRAINVKPDIDIPVGIMYDVEEVA